MKKYMMFLLLFFGLFFSAKNVFAYAAPFENLMDHRNLYIVNTDYSGMKKPITVKKEEMYTLVIAFDAMARDIIEDQEGWITFIDKNSKPVHVLGVFDNINKNFYLELIAQSNELNYISFPYGFYSENIMLYKGHYKQFEGFYIRQTDENRYNNFVKVEVSQLDEPEYLESLVMFKDLDGNKIDYEIDYKDLDLNDVQTGFYDIVYYANVNGVDEYFFLNVEVYDGKGPVITTTDFLYTVYSKNESLTTVLDQLEYQDNIDSKEDILLEVIEDNYSSNIGVIGDYIVKIKLTDSDNNVLIQDVVVRVMTTVKPRLVGPEKINIGTEDIDNLEAHLSQYYSAVSAVEGLELDVVFTIPNNIENKKHTFDVIVTATDRFGNVTNRTIKVTLFPSQSQIEVVLSTLIIKTQTNKVTSDEDFENIIKSELAKQNIDGQFKIVSNTYRGNENKTGNYLLEVVYNANGQEKTMMVSIENTQVQNNYLYIYLIIGTSVTLVMVFLGFKMRKLTKIRKLNQKISN